jgi:glucose-6-phosphate dehydrogenase assembly protein OpcA
MNDETMSDATAVLGSAVPRFSILEKPMTTNILGERTHIDVHAIERELTALWKQAADDHDEAGQAVTRTCVLNLIVVTSGGTERATETVAELTGRYPNRAIVVDAAPTAANELLDAWVQAHCRMPGPGRPQVCCEQITIEARGTAVDRVPGTILPLLVPDVPVMIWWPKGAPFADPRLEKYLDLVDRMIVDSATFDAPEAGLAAQVQLMDGGVEVSDLAWARLTPWRELIAQFFDAPAMLPHLDLIERVSVEYEAEAGTSGDRTQAFLLVGWLGSRLKWRPAVAPWVQAGVTRLVLARPNGGAVQIELRPVEPKADLLDRLAACSLDCPQGRFMVGRAEAPDAAVARSEVEGMQPIGRVVRLQHMSEAELLAEELRMLGHDYGFEGALRLATSLVGQTSSREIK